MTCVILIKDDSFAEPEAIQSKADTKVKADDMINWDKFCSHSAVFARTVPRTECVWVCVYMKAWVCIHTIFWVYMLYMITSDEGWPDQARWDVVPQNRTFLSEPSLLAFTHNVYSDTVSARRDHTQAIWCPPRVQHTATRREETKPWNQITVCRKWTDSHMPSYFKQSDLLCDCS